MIHPGLFQLCVCGHQKRDHIQHEGGCRPGFVCQGSCAKFHAQADADEAREKAIEDWKRAIEDRLLTSGPRSATEATELRPGITERDLKAVMDWDPPTNQQVSDWIKQAEDDMRAGIPKINVCDHIEMEAQIRKFVRKFGDFDGVMVCRNCGLNMRRGDI